MEEKATPKLNTAKVSKPRVKKTPVAGAVKAAPKVAKAKVATVKKATVAKTDDVLSSKDGQIVRIKVSAYENKVLDQSIRQIVDTAMRFDAKFRGPVPLPTEIKKYTVNRSSFIDFPAITAG